MYFDEFRNVPPHPPLPPTPFQHHLGKVLRKRKLLQIRQLPSNQELHTGLHTRDDKEEDEMGF